MTEQAMKDTALAIAGMVGSPGIASVVELDTLLDDVRRTAWFSTFSGLPVQNINQADIYENQKRILAMFKGLSLAEINQAIHWARLHAWATGFGQAGLSRFAQTFDAWTERSAHPATPDKLN